MSFVLTKYVSSVMTQCSNRCRFVEMNVLDNVCKVLDNVAPNCFFFFWYDGIRIRVAGIKGLQGVVRKTVNDELQAIIWEPQHMDKLIPSMLFNMQDADDMDR